MHRKLKIVFLIFNLYFKYKENKLLPIVLLIIFYKLHMIWIWRRIKTNFSTRVMAILSYLGVWSESDFNFLQNSPWMRINKNCMYNLKSEGTSRRNDGRSFKAIFVHCASEKKKLNWKNIFKICREWIVSLILIENKKTNKIVKNDSAVAKCFSQNEPPMKLNTSTAL